MRATILGIVVLAVLSAPAITRLVRRNRARSVVYRARRCGCI